MCIIALNCTSVLSEVFINSPVETWTLWSCFIALAYSLYKYQRHKNSKLSLELKQRHCTFPQNKFLANYCSCFLSCNLWHYASWLPINWSVLNYKLIQDNSFFDYFNNVLTNSVCWCISEITPLCLLKGQRSKTRTSNIQSRYKKLAVLVKHKFQINSITALWKSLIFHYFLPFRGLQRYRWTYGDCSRESLHIARGLKRH